MFIVGLEKRVVVKIFTGSGENYTPEPALMTCYSNLL